ncbi:MAG: hypothetical protein KDK23_11040, partial [Leptospiraceae bacterium]|nr:hypothetical protein [Leptospiraceae bacterium]
VLISDGMFHLEFLDARGQSVRPLRPLSVEMQPSQSEDMGMYRRDGTSWTRVGSAGIEQRWPEDCNVYRRQNDGRPRLILVEDSPCGESVAMRFYQGIDEPAWWNFDKPAPNITCIKGELSIPGNGLQIRLEAAGLDYLGLSSATVQPDGRFAMNVAADKKVKVYALLTDKSSRRIYLGSLPTLHTSSKTAFYNESESECQNVGLLEVHKGQIRHLTDADFFLKSIGLP